MTKSNAWDAVAGLTDTDTAAAIRSQDWSKVGLLWDTDVATAIQNGAWVTLGKLIDTDTSAMVRRAMAESASESDILAASARDDRDFLDDVKMAQHRDRVQYGGEGRVGIK